MQTSVFTVALGPVLAGSDRQLPCLHHTGSVITCSNTEAFAIETVYLPFCQFFPHPLVSVFQSIERLVSLELNRSPTQRPYGYRNYLHKHGSLCHRSALPRPLRIVFPSMHSPIHPSIERLALLELMYTELQHTEFSFVLVVYYGDIDS